MKYRKPRPAVRQNLRPLKFILALAATAAIILPMLYPAFTAAQSNDGVSITTSPLPTSIRANPGETVKTDLKVQNSGKKAFTMKVSLMKFTANNDQGQPRLADREPGDDFFDWASFSKTSFVAEPNEWNTVTMTINVPQSAGLGYYYAVVFSKGDIVKPAKDETAIEGAAAILVLLGVKSPNEKRSTKLVDISADKRVYEFLPVKFTAKLKNEGNIFLAPSGTIFISRGKKEVAKLDFNSGHNNVLPGATRSYDTTWSDGFPVYKEVIVDGKAKKDKNEKNIHKLTWDFNSPLSKFRFGHYTARLVAVYDDGQRDVPLTATVSFWVIPWRFFVVLLVILAIIGYLVYRNIRMRRHLKRLMKEKTHARHTHHEQTKETVSKGEDGDSESS